jgi:multimeric flavodoxin WrbA
MGKKLILHDLPSNKIETLLVGAAAEHTVFSANPAVYSCVGCFGCWLSTPGECLINDRCKGFASMISRHDEFLVISRMVFGGFSPAVKAVIERGIGYISPFFRIVGGEMHHVLRYDCKVGLQYVFYGRDITEHEKEIARRLIAANAINFGVEKFSASFYPSIDEIEVAW